jgi:excisionase family DNA binding protein
MSIHSTGLGDLERALVVNPRTACLMLSCSHKHLYQLMADGEIESFKCGRARKITVASIKALIARGLAASAASPLKRPA